jgi:hypothetical protein
MVQEKDQHLKHIFIQTRSGTTKVGIKIIMKIGKQNIIRSLFFAGYSFCQIELVKLRY